MYQFYSAQAVGTTIDPETLLSTDYFNTANEIIMLIELLPEMPEIAEEIRGWRFRDYEEHFRASNLGIAPLAIAAFAHVPPPVRKAFDEIVAALRKLVKEAQARLVALALASAASLGEEVRAYAARLRSLVEAGSAIVHEGKHTDQSAVDAMF